MHKTLFFRLLLIFVLLFAQLGGLAHGISHTLAEQEQGSNSSLSHDKHGNFCATYAHIGSAIGSSSFSFTGSQTCEPFHLDNLDSCISTAFIAFAARAPPYFV